MNKICAKCGKEKDVREFGIKTSNKDGRNSYCLPCRNDYETEWKSNNPDKEEKRRNKGKEQRAKAKQEVFDYYGNKCTCSGCDVIEPTFLTVGHLDYGNGRKHRKTIGYSTIYIWLVKNNFPDGFRLECYNCNCSARVNNGKCIHEEKQNDIIIS